MLHQQVKEDIKQALLTKNAVKLTAVRSLAAAFTNELVAKRRKPEETLSDEEALTVVRRAVKQRQESIEQFRAGGREDLVQQETTELEILKTYLPPEMAEAEIERLAAIKIKELGVRDKKDAGKIIGALMKELKGRASGAAVKTAVYSSLTNGTKAKPG